MGDLWFDSGWPPPLSSLKTYAGYLFYLSPGDGRRPDPSKATLQTFLDAGLDLAPIWQQGKVDIAAGGFALGADHARRANADADAKGVPSWVPIIYACDADRTLAAVQDYYRGVQSVQGRPVGAYGGAGLCDALHDNLGIEWLMQTIAWSGGRVSTNAQFYQRDTNLSVTGGTVDQVVPLKPYPTWKTGAPVVDNTPDPTAGVQFVQAAHTSSGSNLPPTRIVIHGTVSPCIVGGAVNVAKYFAQESAGGSAHYVVDPATVVQCVLENTIAWHAPPNGKSLGIEMTDPVNWDVGNGKNAGDWDARFKGNEAAFHARWTLPDYDAMLRLTAAVTRRLADKYGIPLVRITPADLKAGKKGICGHVDVSKAFGQTDHTDPGPDFPWDRFMGYVTGDAKPAAPILDVTPRIFTALGRDDSTGADDFPMLLTASGRFVGLDSQERLRLAQQYVAFATDPKATLRQADIGPLRDLLARAS